MDPSTTRPRVRRRFLVILASVSVSGFLAGCLGDDSADGSDDDSTDGGGADASDGNGGDSADGNGDDSTEKVDEKAEQALRQKEEAEATLVSALQQANDENWERCLTEVKEAPGQFDTARQDAQEALQLAEAGGHTDRAEALRVLIEIIDLFQKVQPEAEALCEAGREEDHEEIKDRWETIQALLDEIEQKEEEFDRLVQGNSNLVYQLLLVR